MANSLWSRRWWRSKNLDEALLWASWKGRQDVVEYLTGRSASVSAQNEDGRGALQLAARSGHSAVVRMLIERHADVNVANAFGLTALHWAADRATQWSL